MSRTHYRWWRFSRIETCNDYRPGTMAHPSPSSPLPPEIVLPTADLSQSTEEGINNNNRSIRYIVRYDFEIRVFRPSISRLNSSLMLPSTSLPGGRRPSIMIITDQLMKNQKNKANICPNSKNE